MLNILILAAMNSTNILGVKARHVVLPGGSGNADAFQTPI